MECDIIHKYLCSFLDGEIDIEKRKKIETHLKSCLACNKELEAQKAVKLLIKKRLSTQTAPSSLRHRIESELSRIDEYRDSGIDALDLVRWGSHIAKLYKNKTDLLETSTQYIEKGLEENELCVWVIADISELEAKDAIAKKVPNISEYINKQQLQLFSYKEWYLADGSFNINSVLCKAVDKSKEAITKGYKGLRAEGTLSWLHSSDWNALMEYETLINNALPEHKALIVCVYKEVDYTTNKIDDIAKRHKYLISKDDGNWRIVKNDRIKQGNIRQADMNL